MAEGPALLEWVSSLRSDLGKGSRRPANNDGDDDDSYSSSTSEDADGSRQPRIKASAAHQDVMGSKYNVPRTHSQKTASHGSHHSGTVKSERRRKSRASHVQKISSISRQGHAGGDATFADLCAEDKQRVARLIQELTSLGHRYKAASAELEASKSLVAPKAPNNSNEFDGLAKSISKLEQTRHEDSRRLELLEHSIQTILERSASLEKLEQKLDEVHLNVDVEEQFHQSSHASEAVSSESVESLKGMIENLMDKINGMVESQRMSFAQSTNANTRLRHTELLGETSVPPSMHESMLLQSPSRVPQTEARPQQADQQLPLLQSIAIQTETSPSRSYVPQRQENIGAFRSTHITPSQNTSVETSPRSPSPVPQADLIFPPIVVNDESDATEVVEEQEYVRENVQPRGPPLDASSQPYNHHNQERGPQQQYQHTQPSASTHLHRQRFTSHTSNPSPTLQHQYVPEAPLHASPTAHMHLAPQTIWDILQEANPQPFSFHYHRQQLEPQPQTTSSSSSSQPHRHGQGLDFSDYSRQLPNTHVGMHANTYARMHANTHARMHASSNSTKNPQLSMLQLELDEAFQVAGFLNGISV